MKDELLVANKYILVVNTKTNPEKATEVEVNKNIYDKVIINDEIIVNVTINRIINKAVNYSVDQKFPKKTLWIMYQKHWVLKKMKLRKL